MYIKEAILITEEFLERPRSKTRRKDLYKAIRKVTDYSIICYQAVGDLKTLADNGSSN